MQTRPIQPGRFYASVTRTKNRQSIIYQNNQTGINNHRNKWYLQIQDNL